MTTESSHAVIEDDILVVKENCNVLYLQYDKHCDVWVVPKTEWEDVIKIADKMRDIAMPKSNGHYVQPLDNSYPLESTIITTLMKKIDREEKVSFNCLDTLKEKLEKYKEWRALGVELQNTVQKTQWDFDYAQTISTDDVGDFYLVTTGPTKIRHVTMFWQH